jgi:AraC family transcriptional regulator of adaptative response/methylated-DNA-[protein]-cysteine methyltransferase
MERTLATPRVTRGWRSDEERWAAVQRRERAADGAFFYSVRTTGVYCKPSCAARQPLRENVRLHATAYEAEAAGFRACKRCKPGEPDLAARRAAAIAGACRSIEQAESPPRVVELAAASGMSRFHFQRVFKEVTGITPQSYAREARAARLREKLRGSASVTDAIYAAGFNSSGRFYAQADATLGMAARDYRAGGAGNDIKFAVGECSLGAILVAASERGVCAILLGDDAEALTRELEDRFPNARLEPGGRDFDGWVARVVGLVEAPQTGCDLPLDVRGSAFEQRVWRALRDIPAGSTASYSDVAAAIGAPTSARAVARACAANALAVAIPCHRVVRSDGGLSGYRWGVERKRALLEAERHACGDAVVTETSPRSSAAPRWRPDAARAGRHRTKLENSRD